MRSRRPMRRLWVLEVRDREADRPQWEPTVYVGLTREGARQEAELWHSGNEGFDTRVRMYSPGENW